MGVCRDCISGTLATETPTGTEVTLHGLRTYVSLPNGQPKAVIVVISDMFGWTLPNSRLLADKYAKNGGFLVYLPDFTSGELKPVLGQTD
jgi:dienelactone hydrolase